MASSSDTQRATPWPKAAFQHHTGTCRGSPDYPHRQFRLPHGGKVVVANCPCCTVPPTCPVCLNGHGALLAACRGTTHAEALLAACPGLETLQSGEVLTPDGPVLTGERAFKRFLARVGTTPTEVGAVPKAAPTLKNVPTGKAMLQPTSKAMPQPELPQHPPPPRAAPWETLSDQEKLRLLRLWPHLVSDEVEQEYTAHHGKYIAARAAEGLPAREESSPRKAPRLSTPDQQEHRGNISRALRCDGFIPDA